MADNGDKVDQLINSGVTPMSAYRKVSDLRFTFDKIVLQAPISAILRGNAHNNHFNSTTNITHENLQSGLWGPCSGKMRWRLLIWKGPCEPSGTISRCCPTLPNPRAPQLQWQVIISVRRKGRLPLRSEMLTLTPKIAKDGRRSWRPLQLQQARVSLKLSLSPKSTSNASLMHGKPFLSTLMAGKIPLFLQLNHTQITKTWYLLSTKISPNITTRLGINDLEPPLYCTKT